MRAGAARRGVVAIAAGLLVAAVGAGCSSGDDAGVAVPPTATGTPASPSAPATAEPSAGASPATDPTSADPTASAGCPASGDGVPAGAGSHEVVDVDGDGRPDTAWITPGADRAFGVTTASGATFSTPIVSASPIPASAVVQSVATSDGSAVVALVDVDRETLLVSLAGCAATSTLNAQGDAYTFDRGFAGEGTGVGCTEDGGELRLAGLDAVADGSTFTVTRTFVDLDADARHATNGESETVATDAAKDDPVVTTAQEASCGDLVAGTDGPVEPES